jgi:hypothetical protein
MSVLQDLTTEVIPSYMSYKHRSNFQRLRAMNIAHIHMHIRAFLLRNLPLQELLFQRSIYGTTHNLRTRRWYARLNIGIRPGPTVFVTWVMNRLKFFTSK